MEKPKLQIKLNKNLNTPGTILIFKLICTIIHENFPAVTETNLFLNTDFYNFMISGESDYEIIIAILEKYFAIPEFDKSEFELFFENQRLFKGNRFKIKIKNKLNIQYNINIGDSPDDRKKIPLLHKNVVIKHFRSYV